jgi:hypothetical protein
MPVKSKKRKQRVVADLSAESWYIRARERLSIVHANESRALVASLSTESTRIEIAN